MYEYKKIRPKIFTEKGQEKFLAIQRNVEKKLSSSGAVTMASAITGTGGDAWDLMACVDRLVELGELREVTAGQDVRGQDRVFIKG